MKGALGSTKLHFVPGASQISVTTPSHPGINMLHLMAPSGVSLMLLKHVTLLTNSWHTTATAKMV